MCSTDRRDRNVKGDHVFIKMKKKMYSCRIQSDALEERKRTKWKEGVP